MNDQHNLIKRIRTIDITKGIAIFCVLWGHCIQGMTSGTDFFNLWAVKFIYSFHMPLFALISGFLFFFTCRKNVVQIFKSRLFSLGIPFFVWNLLLYFRRCVFDIWVGHNFQFNIVVMLHSLFSGLWFLKSLFIIIVLATVIFKYSKKSYKYLYSFAIWMVLIFFSNICGDHTADLFPFFVLGYYISEHMDVQGKIYKCRYIIYLVFFILLFCMKSEYFVYVSGINPFKSEYGFTKQVYFNFYRFMIGVCGSFSVILFVKQISKKCGSNLVIAFCEEMGRSSLQLYVLQSFLLEGVLSQVIACLPLNSVEGGVQFIC